MRKYKIKVTETLQKIVEIEANSLDDAIDKAECDYDNCDIILDTDDFSDIKFELVG